MDANLLQTIVVSALTILGSAGAWKFYEKRVSMKDKRDSFIQEDCRERIIKLEALLERSYKEKESLGERLLILTSQVAELRVKVEFLESENEYLSKIKNTKRPLNE